MISSMRFTQATASRTVGTVLDPYRIQEAERAALGIPPLPLTPAQVTAVIEALHAPVGDQTAGLVGLLTHRVCPGVADGAQVKARFLTAITRGEDACPALGARDAVRLLGTMLGGYNVAPLVELLDDDSLGADAAAQLASMLLVFDAFHDVAERAQHGNPH